MRLIPGCVVLGCWQWEHFKRFADHVSRQVLGREGVCTAGTNGKHSENSLHYYGLAWDLRVWKHPTDSSKGRFDNDTCEKYAQSLRDAFGVYFDVVVHYDESGTLVTHIHVEMDIS